ncbi:DNA mismatch endonuclease (patch repair protein) [Agrobacterium tumefaciens]|uniref:Very short patch repair endonuclease n=2 Tax=Agrobacterium TaxID=357 RepID=A0ABR6JGI9_AGRRD|nr:DNA mismatch endonuclease (patch repair protein) [Agrobacterium radiobacter]TCV46100.1 T/G mismatch-specific endonuclease [Agrobacterium tumefaciens]MBB4321559.1 DNA mismatch endonuclease (patch repair protein) [Agrobacterium radiobacter]MBB4326175.1 DNA mismatch endonuclease (patch repair protein) [Agrobacterium radiobacter]MBB4338599.1 DNA mismatch endonuclease (patch repair protein) [Agrobacterium radiobacter]
MAAIKGSHTKPELMVRHALHAKGLRYKLHSRDLPGKPDLVFPKYRAVVFVHGCFWHRHDCHLFKWPSTRQEFWAEKISRNVLNDDLAMAKLRENGWRIGTVWECALKGRTRLDFAIAMQKLADWVKSGESMLTIRGE